MVRGLGPVESQRTIQTYSKVQQAFIGYPDRLVIFYTDQACTQLADIRAYDPAAPAVVGAAISGSQVQLDRNSRTVQFWFPDGVVTLYAKVGRGPVIQVSAVSLGIAPVQGLTNTVAASGAAVTLPDVTSATVHHITLTANCTLTLPAAAAGKSMRVVLKQDGTGSRTVTWPAAVKWPSGTAPTLSTAGGAVDMVSLVCANGTNWLGVLAGAAFA